MFHAISIFFCLAKSLQHRFLLPTLTRGPPSNSLVFIYSVLLNLFLIPQAPHSISCAHCISHILFLIFFGIYIFHFSMQTHTHTQQRRADSGFISFFTRSIFTHILFDTPIIHTFTHHIFSFIVLYLNFFSRLFIVSVILCTICCHILKFIVEKDSAPIYVVLCYVWSSSYRRKFQLVFFFAAFETLFVLPHLFLIKTFDFDAGFLCVCWLLLHNYGA